MQLDYNIRIIYPKWIKGENGLPIADNMPLYVEITLYNVRTSCLINGIFGTAFLPQHMKIVDYDTYVKVHNFLSEKGRGFIGLWGDNQYELASEYWGWDKK